MALKKQINVHKKSRFADLLAKSMAGSATQAEIEELTQFLNRFPQYKVVQQVSGSIVQENKEQNTVDIEWQINELWSRINEASAETVPEPVSAGKGAYIRPLKWIGTVAAVLIIGLVFTLIITNDNNPAHISGKLAALQKIHVPFGKIKELTLPDGTKVKLNSGSHFSYPLTFSGKTREVTLDGEGFFEVSKNTDKPFFVHTSGISVKVLGTVFNVKAYREEPKIETTLLEGKIEVEFAANREKKVLLTPHEKLTVNKKVSPRSANNPESVDTSIKYEVTALPQTNDDVYQENAWINGRLMFTNTYFEEVTLAMERKYDVKIIFEDAALGKEQISGVLENESLDKALSILGEFIPFERRIAGRTVYISRKKKQ